jgi:hypothetical protein
MVVGWVKVEDIDSKWSFHESPSASSPFCCSSRGVSGSCARRGGLVPIKVPTKGVAASHCKSLRYIYFSQSPPFMSTSVFYFSLHF